MNVDNDVTFNNQSSSVHPAGVEKVTDRGATQKPPIAHHTSSMHSIYDDSHAQPTVSWLAKECMRTPQIQPDDSDTESVAGPINHNVDMDVNATNFPELFNMKGDPTTEASGISSVISSWFATSSNVASFHHTRSGPAAVWTKFVRRHYLHDHVVNETIILIFPTLIPAG